MVIDAKKTSSGIGAVKRDYIKSGRTCHIGVQCDGCLVYPIMGPRFKSKLKEDYDLCSICFATMGNEAENKQIDVPITVHCPGLAKNFTDVDAFIWRSANRVEGVEAPSTCADGYVDTESVNNCDPADGHIDHEQMLRDTLEQMGFKQTDLNKDILRKNEFSLDQSITNLCDKSEWDAIHDELEQLGFCDKEKNVKLLKKNEGSIKQVVMDLLSEETE